MRTERFVWGLLRRDECNEVESVETLMLGAERAVNPVLSEFLHLLFLDIHLESECVQLVMKRVLPILLIGTISMLTAEVFAGSSQLWFLVPLALLLAFPLYMFHVVLILAVALRSNRVKIVHLYFLGVVFALYESWITKVLWAGYQNTNGPEWGTFLGLGVLEFPILVFFWHPVMSIILPILIYQILTKKVIVDHKAILKRSILKTLTIVVVLGLVSTFIANGNGYDLISANLAVLGTVCIILLLWLLSRNLANNSISSFKFPKIGIGILLVYLLGLYVLTYYALSPEKLPTESIAYISILVSYAFAGFLYFKFRQKDYQIDELGDENYRPRHLLLFLLLLLVFVNLSCVLMPISSVVLVFGYLGFTIAGIVLFVMNTVKVLFER